MQTVDRSYADWSISYLTTDMEPAAIGRVNRIETLAESIAACAFGGPETRSDLGNALQVCDLVSLEARSFSGVHCIREKLTSLRGLLCAVAGSDHSRRQHHMWGIQAPGCLPDSIHVSPARDQSAHEG